MHINWTSIKCTSNQYLPHTAVARRKVGQYPTGVLIVKNALEPVLEGRRVQRDTRGTHMHGTRICACVPFKQEYLSPAEMDLPSVLDLPPILDFLL